MIREGVVFSLALEEWFHSGVCHRLALHILFSDLGNLKQLVEVQNPR